MSIPSKSYTFSEGTLIKSSEVNQNFDDAFNAINDGSKDIGVSNLYASGVYVSGVATVATTTVGAGNLGPQLRLVDTHNGYMGTLAYHEASGFVFYANNSTAGNVRVTDGDLIVDGGGNASLRIRGTSSGPYSGPAIVLEDKSNGYSGVFAYNQSDGFVMTGGDFDITGDMVVHGGGNTTVWIQGTSAGPFGGPAIVLEDTFNGYSGVINYEQTTGFVFGGGAVNVANGYICNAGTGVSDVFTTATHSITVSGGIIVDIAAL